MPSGKAFGRREGEGTASGEEGMPREGELARLEGEGTGPEGRGMRREEAFGSREDLFR
jgi:hypothetical protein